MRLMGLFVFAAALLFASNAQAQRPQAPDRDEQCFDDNMANRCAAESQRATRTRFEVPAAQDVNAQGVTMRRAFFVDGYGNDLPVVSIERRPTDAPRVVVSVRVATLADTRIVRLTAPLPLAAWDEAIEASRHFHRRLAADVTPLAPGRTRLEQGGCLHSWLFTVEATDPGADAPVRSAMQDACYDGLAQAFAFQLAELAATHLPQCSGLGAFELPITKLSWCALLEGDTVAAGEALTKERELSGLMSTEHANILLIHDGARLEWAGEPVVSGFETFTAWPRLMEDRMFRPERIIGENANRVRMLGQLQETRTGENAGRRFAQTEQVWVRENGFDYRLVSMRVGTFGAWEIFGGQSRR